MQAERMILEMFKPENLPVKYLVTAHDAFGYYAQLTDLENIGLQGLSTETEVSAFDVQSIASLIVEKRIPAMFVESSVSEDAVRAVQAAAAAQGWDVQLGGELYSDALGPQGSGGDTYLGMLRTTRSPSSRHWHGPRNNECTGNGDGSPGGQRPDGCIR